LLSYVTIELSLLVPSVVPGIVHIIMLSHLRSWQRGFWWTASLSGAANGGSRPDGRALAHSEGDNADPGGGLAEPEQEAEGRVIRLPQDTG
jgi:hypothetical protein